MSDLVLPAFELDCRDWLVVGPAEAGLDLDSGTPTLAVLSTVVLDEDIAEVTGALTVGLLDAAEELATRPVAPGCVARELLDDGASRRYVMPSPNGDTLALVAEFVVPEICHDELDRRVTALMSSFRWQAA